MASVSDEQHQQQLYCTTCSPYLNDYLAYMKTLVLILTPENHTRDIYYTIDRKRMKIVHWIMAATNMSGLYSYTHQLYLKSLEIGYDVPGCQTP
jgi:hypothetical protein